MKLVDGIISTVTETVRAAGRPDLFQAPPVGFSDAAVARYLEQKQMGEWLMDPRELFPADRSILTSAPLEAAPCPGRRILPPATAAVLMCRDACPVDVLWPQGLWINSALTTGSWRTGEPKVGLGSPDICCKCAATCPAVNMA